MCTSIATGLVAPRDRNTALRQRCSPALNLPDRQADGVVETP
jgi:hypothetical protein